MYSNNKALIDKCRQYPIEDILVGRKRKRVGSKIMFSCPLHNDKTPSFCVYPDGSYYCFACAEHGRDVIDLVRSMTGCKFREALDYIEKRTLTNK